MSETKTGKIKFYNGDRGYGFIKCDSGEEFFYHITDLADENYRPQSDDRVRFSVVTGKKGPKATNVEYCR